MNITRKNGPSTTSEEQVSVVPMTQIVEQTDQPLQAQPMESTPSPNPLGLSLVNGPSNNSKQPLLNNIDDSVDSFEEALTQLPSHVLHGQINPETPASSSQVKLQKVHITLPKPSNIAA